jgi:predicted RNA-binding Zn-ribbon protein involved in translation (DUF1610 family)
MSDKHKEKREPCPRCNKNLIKQCEGVGMALSRVDNKTYICSDCGVREAFNREEVLNLREAVTRSEHKDCKQPLLNYLKSMEERNFQKNGCKTCGGRTVYCLEHGEFVCVKSKCDGACYHVESETV